VLNEKYLLKSAVGDLIPRSIRNRKKQPYRAPDSQSFLTGGREAKLHDYAEELLAPRAIAEAGLFDPDRVGKLVEKARAGQVIGVKDNMAFVGILSAQIVVDRFIKNFPKECKT
jgi:asparagine synthase (glutamine-hydrolysing)